MIDAKCDDWLRDPKMAKYLRPETLFAASHFESYLNEHAEPGGDDGPHCDCGFRWADWTGSYCPGCDAPRPAEAPVA